MTTLRDPALADGDITLANWMRQPYNRVAFQRVGELIPSARIAGAGTPATPWPVAADASSELDTDLAATVRATLDATYTDAFVVMKAGRVVHEEYRSGMTPASRHLCMSVSKSVAGTVAGLVIGGDGVDPETLVTDVVPEFARTGLAGATLRHVLDMRTGTREDITTLELQRAYYATALWAPPPEPDDPGRDTDTRQHFWRFQQERPHGTEFAYRSTLTCVLALILERLTERSYPALLGQFWSAVGADDAEITVDGAGHALADIGFSCTARDLTRLGETLRLQGTTPSGDQVLPASWIGDILTPDDDSHDAFVANGSAYLDTATAYYRDQWWVARPRTSGHDGAYFALGIHGQLLYVDETADLVITKFSTWPDPWDDTHVRATYELCALLAERL